MEAIGKPQTEPATSSLGGSDDVCPKCSAELEFDRNGYPMRHQCCSCLDTGRVRYALQIHEPGFGRAHDCPDCAGERKAPLAHEALRMRIPIAFQGKTLDGWADVGDQRRRVTAYVSQWPPKKPFLVLAGTPGTGKTHLACAALQDLYERKNVRGQFWNCVDLIARYQATYDGERATESAAEVDETLARVPLLVLDELGAQRDSEDATLRVFRLIDLRYREQKPMIVTTNKSAGQLGEMDPRLYSRLMDASVSELVTFNLPDYRQRR